MTVALLAMLFIAGVACGAFFWDHTVTSLDRRAFEREIRSVMESREMWKSIVMYAADQRLNTSRALYLATKDNPDHSRKVVQLRSAS